MIIIFLISCFVSMATLYRLTPVGKDEDEDDVEVKEFKKKVISKSAMMLYEDDDEKEYRDFKKKASIKFMLK